MKVIIENRYIVLHDTQGMVFKGTPIGGKFKKAAADKEVKEALTKLLRTYLADDLVAFVTRQVTTEAPK